jgi:CheY-like chemotaxis protein
MTHDNPHQDEEKAKPVLKKILVVDDNSDIRRLIRLTLSGPYEIIEANSGDAAMAMLRQAMPDLVILDIMMPGGMDGLQVLEAIKTTPELQHILVLMVTARGQSSDLELGLSKGADSYLVKPFSPLSLMQWVKGKLA